MEAIEEGDEIVATTGEVGGAGDVEVDAVGDAGSEGGLARVHDRRSVIVKAVEPALGVSLRHDDGRSPVPAADVGHLGSGFELLLYSAEGGDPVGDQVADVARPEEALGPLEQVVVMLAPEHALA